MSFKLLMGWLGSICFAICGAPQAWQCYKRGNAHGVNSSFLLLWLGGEIFTLIYVIPDKIDLPRLVNYLINIVFIAIIVYYRFKPRSENVQ